MNVTTDISLKRFYKPVKQSMIICNGIAPKDYILLLRI